MDTSKNEIFLQIPCERNQDTPRARMGRQSGTDSSLHITERSLAPSLLSVSATSFHSIFEDGLKSVEKQRQEQLEALADDTGGASPDTSASHWIGSTREIVIIFMALVLCFNMVSQSARNTALKTSLHNILEERDRTTNEKSSDDLSPRPQLQKLQKSGRGSEDMWWSVVGNGDARDIGHLTIGVVTMDSPYTVSTCDAANSIANGEHPASEEQHADEKRLTREAESGQKVEDDEELQKRLARILLEENPLIERAQRVLVRAFSFFWSLVFGV